MTIYINKLSEWKSSLRKIKENITKVGETDVSLLSALELVELEQQMKNTEELLSQKKREFEEKQIAAEERRKQRQKEKEVAERKRVEEEKKKALEEKQLKQKQQLEEKKRLREKKREAAALKRKQIEEAARKKIEEAARKRQKKEAVKRKKEEAARKKQEQALNKKQEEEAARKKQEESARKKQEEAFMKRQEEEALKKKQEEAFMKRQEEEALKKKQEEAFMKRQEEEALKKKQEEAFMKRQEEEALKKKQGKAARKKQEEEALKKKQEEEAARKKQEEDDLIRKNQLISKHKKGLKNSSMKNQKTAALKQEQKEIEMRKQKAIVFKKKREKINKGEQEITYERKHEGPPKPEQEETISPEQDEVLDCEQEISKKTKTPRIRNVKKAPHTRIQKACESKEISLQTDLQNTKKSSDKKMNKQNLRTIKLPQKKIQKAQPKKGLAATKHMEKVQTAKISEEEKGENKMRDLVTKKKQKIKKERIHDTGMDLSDDEGTFKSKKTTIQLPKKRKRVVMPDESRSLKQDGQEKLDKNEKIGRHQRAVQTELQETHNKSHYALKEGDTISQKECLSSKEVRFESKEVRSESKEVRSESKEVRSDKDDEILKQACSRQPHLNSSDKQPNTAHDKESSHTPVNEQPNHKNVLVPKDNQNHISSNMKNMQLETRQLFEKENIQPNTQKASGNSEQSSAGFRNEFYSQLQQNKEQLSSLFSSDKTHVEKVPVQSIKKVEQVKMAQRNIVPMGRPKGNIENLNFMMAFNKRKNEFTLKKMEESSMWRESFHNQSYNLEQKPAVTQQPAQFTKVTNDIYKLAMDRKMGTINNQNTKFDPNEFVPKTRVPLFTSSNEIEFKRDYKAADWVKLGSFDSDIVHQNHFEIKNYFDTPNVDIVSMFPMAKNVTNDSPNKMR